MYFKVYFWLTIKHHIINIIKFPTFNLLWVHLAEEYKYYINKFPPYNVLFKDYLFSTAIVN